MSHFLAKIVLSAALASGAATLAHADWLPSQHMTSGSALPIVRSVHPIREHVAPPQSPEARRATSAPLSEVDGLCCGTIGAPVIPQDTPMRQPIVPTAPSMPGQPPAIGTTAVQ